MKLSLIHIYTREGEIQYKTVPVVRSDLRSTIQATGTLNPVETVDVGTQILSLIHILFFGAASRSAYAGWFCTGMAADGRGSPVGLGAVSYTHLDVYKRQVLL